MGIDLGDPAAVFWGAMWGAPIDGTSLLRGLARGFLELLPLPPMGVRIRLAGPTRCRRYRGIRLPVLSSVELARIARSIRGWLRRFAACLDSELVDALLAASAGCVWELDKGAPTSSSGSIGLLETLAFEALLVQRAVMHWRFLYSADPLLSLVAAPLQVRHRVLIQDTDMSRILAGVCDRVCASCAEISSDIPCNRGLLRQSQSEGCLRQDILREHDMDRFRSGHVVRSLVMGCACSPPDMVHPSRLHVFFDIWDVMA